MALSKDGPQIFTLDCAQNGPSETLKLEEGYPMYLTAEFAKFSPVHGKTLAVVDHYGVHFVDIETKCELVCVDRAGILAMEWSPQESYVITCEKLK